MLVPLILTGIITTTTVERIALKQAVDQLDSLADSKENELKVFINAQYSRLQGITARTALRTFVTEYNTTKNEEVKSAIFADLTDAQEPFPDVYWIAAYDESNNLIVSTDTSKTEGMIPNAYTPSSIDRRPIITLDPNGEYLILSGPLYREEVYLGYIAISVRASILTSLIQTYTGLGRTGETLIARRTPTGDAEFVNIRRFEHEIESRSVIPKTDLDVPITQALLKRELILTDAIDYRNQKVIAATRYLEEPDWGMVVKIDTQELRGKTNSFRTTVIILLTIIMGFASFMAYVVAVSLSKPIEILTSVAQRVARGETSATLPETLIKEQNEIGILSREFSAMLATINKSHQALEQQVSERTKELNDSHRRLEEKISELEKTNQVMVGRELKMIELKKQLAENSNQPS